MEKCGSLFYYTSTNYFTNHAQSYPLTPLHFTQISLVGFPQASDDCGLPRNNRLSHRLTTLKSSPSRYYAVCQNPFGTPLLHPDGRMLLKIPRMHKLARDFHSLFAIKYPEEMINTLNRE